MPDKEKCSETKTDTCKTEKKCEPKTSDCGPKTSACCDKPKN